MNNSEGIFIKFANYESFGYSALIDKVEVTRFDILKIKFCDTIREKDYVSKLETEGWIKCLRMID